MIAFNVQNYKHKDLTMRATARKEKKVKSNARLASNDPTAIGNGFRHAGHRMDAIGHKSDELLNRSRDAAKKVQKNIKPYSDQLAKKIEKNPIKSALIAGCVGLLLGKFLK